MRESEFTKPKYTLIINGEAKITKKDFFELNRLAKEYKEKHPQDDVKVVPNKELDEANIKLQRIDMLENQVKELEASLATKAAPKPEPKKETKPAAKKEVKKVVPAKKPLKKTKAPAVKAKEKKPLKK